MTKLLISILILQTLVSCATTSKKEPKLKKGDKLTFTLRKGKPTNVKGVYSYSLDDLKDVADIKDSAGNRFTVSTSVNRDFYKALDPGEVCSRTAKHEFCSNAQVRNIELRVDKIKTKGLITDLRCRSKGYATPLKIKEVCKGKYSLSVDLENLPNPLEQQIKNYISAKRKHFADLDLKDALTNDKERYARLRENRRRDPKRAKACDQTMAKYKAQENWLLGRTLATKKDIDSFSTAIEKLLPAISFCSNREMFSPKDSEHPVMPQLTVSKALGLTK